jgi:cobyrinic acid a,c-diamide synthase
MTPRLASIGYREVVTTEPTVLGPAGTRFRGHEFHYGELAGTPGVSPVYQIAGAPGRAEGWSAGATLGTWVHAHFGSNPALAASFVGACLQRRTPSRE